MTKLTSDELKKHLKSYEREELVNIIADLSEVSRKARNYLAAEIHGEEAVHALYAEAKKTVREQVVPETDDSRPHLSRARKTINDFKKSTGNQPLTLDLMLYFVEAGTEFAAKNKDLEDRFYSRMATMYSEVADECEVDELLFHQFNERLYSVLEMAAPIETDYPAILTDRYYSISWVEDYR